MSYKKPQIVAKSAVKMSYAAGCPAKVYMGGPIWPGKRAPSCIRCEISGR